MRGLRPRVATGRSSTGGPLTKTSTKSEQTIHGRPAQRLLVDGSAEARAHETYKWPRTVQGDGM